MTSQDERAARLEEAVRQKRGAARLRAAGLPPRPPGRPAHLGEMQQSLWLLHRMSPSSAAYNLASAFRVRGALRVAELERALNEVVARHRLLRSTFEADGEAVLQVVRPHAPLAVEVIAADAGQALAAATEQARAPFDLASEPPVRMRLVAEPAGGERLLLLVVHHILCDERSLGLLWRELARAYRGRSAMAPEIQYDDYAYWARGRDAAGRRRRLAYWRRRLEPLPEDLELPFERPPGGGAARGRLIGRRLSGAERGVRRLAAATGTSPFAACAFAFRLLLDRYTAGRRVAFATPVSTRSHPATADMIGYFLNPVVIAGGVDEDSAVAAALRAFGGELRSDLAHAAVPFQVLAEKLVPPRRRDRHPLFQAMFVYQEAQPPARLDDARLEPVALDLGESKFDLTLFATAHGETLEIALEYRADRFAEVWMQNLLGHYATLLERLPASLDRATAEVPMLAEHEERELAAASRGAALDSGGTPLLPERILERARRSPAAPAVSGGGARLGYGELASSGLSIARALVGRGVEPGARVGLFLDRSPAMIAAVLGSQWAGAAYVPLDPGYPQARNREALADAEVAAVVTSAGLRGGLPSGPWPVVLADGPATESPRGGDPQRLPALSPGLPAYVLYTSGSTGRPKGVVVTHDNLRASTAARLARYDFAPERFLLLPSLAFDSSVAGIFWTLATGGALVIASEDEARDPRRLVELVARERISCLLCVPSLYAEMLRAGSDRMGALEAAIVAGESCSPRLVEEHFRLLPRVRLFNEYGPTEATVWATVEEITAGDAARPIPIGRPVPGVTVDVLDRRGRRVPVGVAGRAWIAGPTVAAGYWRRPGLTAERFVPTPGGGRSYCTGDRVAWTEDRRLRFLGREDDQIKLRGFRIEPGEIEAALLELSGVEKAAVTVLPVAAGARPGAAAAADDSAGRQLVAFCQGPGAGTDWRRRLGERLPSHMIPSRLVALPALPLLPNGKLDRRRLGELALAAEPPAEPARAVPSSLEQALSWLWEGLLGRSGIGADDNFFELGGHSLLVVEMVAALERDLEVTLSAADVFESPTVGELVRRIEQRRGAAATPYDHLYPIQPGGHGSPFVVALPHFFTAMLAARFRGERPVYGLRGVGLRAEGNLGRWRSLRQLGQELADEIRRRFADQECILAGYSFGALMAVEAARLLEEEGSPPRRLYLIAPMPLDIYRFGPLRLQLDGLRRPVDELLASEALRLWVRGNHPLGRGPYRRAWRRLAVEPGRRLLCLAGRLRRRAGLPLTPRILHADVRVDRFRLHARYRPRPVSTPTVFFNAREAATDAAATWRPFFRGPLRVVEIPDPHLDEASVAAAREVILRHLADVGPDAGSGVGENARP